MRLSTGGVDSSLIAGLFQIFYQIACFFPQTLPKSKVAVLPKQCFQQLLPSIMDASDTAGAAISTMGLRNETNVRLKSFTAIF